MGLSTVYDAGILSDICFPSRHHEIELPDLFLLLPKIYTVVSRCCPSLAAWDMRTCGVLGTPLWEVILGLLWSKEEEAGWQKGHRRTGSLKQGSHPQTDQIQKQIEMNRDGMSCLKRLEHRCFSIVLVKAWYLVAWQPDSLLRFTPIMIYKLWDRAQHLHFYKLIGEFSLVVKP